MIPLEDTFHDILGKAMRGLKLTESQVATAADVSLEAVQALTAGQWSEATARRVAPVLDLGPDALVSVGNGWAPAPVAVDGLARFNTPYEEMMVNSYLAWDPASREAVAFDAGSDCTGMLQLIADLNLQVACILLTHTHGDHIFDLDRLRARTGAKAYVGEHEPLEGAESFAAGNTFEAGALRISTRLTWGHSRGAITYVVEGLPRPVAVVGDAIFAGSMGGGGVSYEAALTTNREYILSLAGDTVLCPGHGPLTTVDEEKAHNPFFT